jgi:hypothetical protein
LGFAPRDFAVRSAGFPVAGLDAFGAKDESGRLQEVAAGPAFREALIWQDRGALATAADGLLKDAVKPSKRRQREEVVARYWQRYCSKNDTGGFDQPRCRRTPSDAHRRAASDRSDEEIQSEQARREDD